MHFSCRMTDLIQTKFCTSIPWADLVIYLKRHPNCSGFQRTMGVKIEIFQLIVALASNTAYCATTHNA